MTLTSYEATLIEEHRAEQARKVASWEFQRRALATAYAFDQWEEASGEGLTFSTFINSFGYQESDGPRMYEAVKCILEVVSEKIR